MVLEYRRPVLRHKSTQTLNTMAAPAGLFDRSFADVSLIAGLLIDKFLYHLPLHRQHQRMAMAGVTLSRSTLTQLVQNGIELLRPLVETQQKSVLKSTLLAIDETPIKAGRKEKGKMKNAWFWLLYGEQDEVVFTFSTRKSAKHLQPLLKDWQGIMLTDGNPVYDSYCNIAKNVRMSRWLSAGYTIGAILSGRRMRNRRPLPRLWNISVRFMTLKESSRTRILPENKTRCYAKNSQRLLLISSLTGVNSNASAWT